MQGKEVYLTFKANEEMNVALKMTARMMNLTQPELIYKICSNFLDELNKICEEQEPDEAKIKNALEYLSTFK